ncbi:MAG: hypothetical protein PHT07_15115 [Paludibacter sp.]|nr:hypothetical protein [Paludibacter sp.]
MAIPTTNVNLNADVRFQLWGDTIGAPTTNVSLNDLAKTVNAAAGNHGMSMFKGLSASLTRTPTSLSWAAGVYGNKTITVTANCAWKCSYAGDARFTIQSATQSVILAGSQPTGVFGGNGVISVNRASASPGAYSGTVTITFSNGAGGTTTLTVSITATA